MGYEIGFENDQGNINPPIEQGSTFKLTVKFPNIFTDDGVNATVRAQFRPKIEKTEHTDFTCTITSRTVTAGDVQGYITYDIVMAATVTAGLPPGVGYWDTEIIGTVGSDTAYVYKPCGAGQRCLVVAEATR